MLKIIYAGTPEFAVPALESLLQSEQQVVAVYTQPDRPAGRGRKLQQSPVKACALAAGLPVLQPQDFKSPEDLRDLLQLDADLMVVAAYGLLLPPAVLAARPSDRPSERPPGGGRRPPGGRLRFERLGGRLRVAG